MNRRGLIAVVAVVVAIGIAGGGYYLSRRTATDKQLSVRDVSEMYPVPPNGETAWILDSAMKMEDRYASAQDSSGKGLFETAKYLRKAASSDLQKLDSAGRATAKFYGQRLPHYSIEELMPNASNAVEYLLDFPSLYDAAILQKRLQEYIGKIGRDEFAKRHPRSAWYLDFKK